MLVAVTGGSGFIGSHVVSRLCNVGIKVRGLRNHTDITPHKNLTCVDGNIEDNQVLEQLVDGVDAVVHCAGLVAACSADAFHNINVKATRSLAQLSMKAGVSRFLLISSLAARESHLSDYAASKYAAEQTLVDVNELAWDALRPPAIYGPGDLRMLSMFSLLKRRIALLVAERQALVSVLYVEDLADAVRCWLDSTLQPSGSIYEIDDGVAGGYTWKDLMNIAAVEMEIRPRFIKLPRWLSSCVGHGSQMLARFVGNTPFITPGKIREFCHPNWVCEDNKIFQNITAWKPRYTFNAGVKKTLKWYKSNNML